MTATAEQLVQRIRRLPDLERGLRKVLMNRFTYGLICGIEEKRLVIVAVAHLHREPRYWIDRLTSDK